MVIQFHPPMFQNLGSFVHLTCHVSFERDIKSCQFILCCVYAMEMKDPTRGGVYESWSHRVVVSLAPSGRSGFSVGHVKNTEQCVHCTIGPSGGFHVNENMYVHSYVCTYICMKDLIRR